MSSIKRNDPVIFLEPKALYRNAEDEVPIDEFELEISKSHIKKIGKHITLIGWGNIIR